MPRLGLIGAAGFVAPRHLRAMTSLGAPCLLACDVHDSVGVLDRHAPDARFFSDERAFFAAAKEARLELVSICSPNDLHERHVVAALEAGADALCEKPLALDEPSLDRLRDAERRTGRRIWSVLQLRVHPAIERRAAAPRSAGRAQVAVDYITPRGDWYDHSWKADAARSGGLALNIGVHLFDLATWLFGAPVEVRVLDRSARTLVAEVTLERADAIVRLSADRAHATAKTHRIFRIDDDVIDLSTIDDGLHTEVLRRVLAGDGFGVEDARLGIRLAVAAQRAAVDRRA